MIRANIFSAPLRTLNQAGFILPLLRNQQLFKQYGITFSVYSDLKRFLTKGADVVLTDSRTIQQLFNEDKSAIIDLLTQMRNSARLLFFDLEDSSGTGFFWLLPHVDKYCKAYVYRDRTLYCKEHYAGRIWPDYYHKAFGVSDSSPRENAIVKSPSDLKKIHHGYLLGLLDFTSVRPWSRSLRNFEFQRRLGLLSKVSRDPPTHRVAQPHRPRHRDISCRINMALRRESLAFHRTLIAKTLGTRTDMHKISLPLYMNEMKDSKVVISPFGWGEINLPRDYEVAVAGAILMKPQFDHLETFPPIFDRHTTVFFDWDCSDLNSKITTILRHHDDYIPMAQELQRRYMRYVFTYDGALDFVKHVKELLLL